MSGRLLWIAFLARGAFCCLALPMWEGFDEYAHFAYAQRVAAGEWLIRPEARATREVERSIELVPMPWVVRSDPPPHETHESYWRLPAEERHRRERELAALPRSLAGTDAVNNLSAETQQPPLNYWLMAAVYKLVAGLGLPARVLTLRLLNLLLASAAVPLAWMAARRIFPKDSSAPIAVAAAVALVPELMFDAARVANSGLALAFFSVLTLLCLDVIDGRRGAAVKSGAVLGLGLLTKAYFLTAAPALAAVLLWAVWRRRLRLPSAVASLAAALAISAWWYARNLRLTGSLSGVIQDAGLREVALADRLRHVAGVDWLAALDSTFFSHIWFGGWSFLQLRAWIYHVFALLAVAAAVGLVVAWFRREPARGHIGALSAIYAMFCAGIAYHVLLTFLVNGISSSAGWYLCAVIVPGILLVSIGLRAIAPAAVSALAIAFALLDLYGMLFVALPYYTGLIRHKPSGFLESFHFAQLFQTGFGEVLRRIATNKPDVVGSAAIAVAGCAYVFATIALAASAVVGQRRTR